MTKKNIWWLAALIALLIYSGLIEPYWIKVETHELTISGFPEEPVCIVHIADTHTIDLGIREGRLIKMMNDLRPDYIFITGDLLKKHSKLGNGLAFASMLTARKGVFAVCGNSDAVIEKARAKGTLLESTPHLSILFNESVDCGDFTLVGLDDPVTHRADPELALAGVDMSRPVIVLTHFHPDDILRQLAAAGVDMVFSGHTHGGQLGIPTLVKLVPYASRSDYISGLFDVDGLRLHVTKGIGTNIFPFRFLCRPQVDVFYIRGTGE
jgi:predicted MPP superfamily phosphohydrolase